MIINIQIKSWTPRDTLDLHQKVNIFYKFVKFIRYDLMFTKMITAFVELQMNSE